jgi:hypothetical protein
MKNQTNQPQKILCAKCYKNLFYAQSNIIDELILKCKSCGAIWNLHLKPINPPLIQPIIDKNSIPKIRRKRKWKTQK